MTALLIILLITVFYFRIYYSICGKCGKVQETDKMKISQNQFYSEEKLFNCKKCQN